MYTLHLAARDMYCRVLMGVMVELSVGNVAMVYIGMDWSGMLTVCANASASILCTVEVVPCRLARYAGTD